MLVTINGGGSEDSNPLSTRSRAPNTTSLTLCSLGSDSQAGKITGALPEKFATSSAKSSTSCRVGNTTISEPPLGRASPDAAAASAQQDPQAPSTAAFPPAWRASTTA